VGALGVDVGDLTHLGELVEGVSGIRDPEEEKFE